MSENPQATVVILTYNAGLGLRPVLEAVMNQRAPFAFETLVIDSGSSDGTLELLREYPVQVIRIDPEDFQHGRTRNAAVELARGEYVAFLTHDAEPASPFWLRDLIACFDLDERVGAVFGRHLPHSDCDPFTAHEIIEHFRAMGPDDAPSVQEILPGTDGWEHYRAHEAALGFFSDVNGCVRRSVWKKVPYRELDYAEDQRLGRDLLESGYKKVYCPSAAVYHSHTYTLGEYFRRMYDEFLGLKLAVGYVEARSVWRVMRDSAAAGVIGSRYVRTLRYLPAHRRARLMVYGFIRALLRRTAAYLAARHERLPEDAARFLSLESKPAAGGRDLSLVRRALKVLRERGAIGFLRALARRLGRSRYLPKGIPTPTLDHLRIDPRASVPTLPVRPARRNLAINWVVPPFGIASGGHMTIARLVRHLENLGHLNRLYLVHPSDDDWVRLGDAKTEKEVIRKHFQPVEAEVFIGVEDVLEADVTIATSWETAYIVHGISKTRARCYLVQDFEPYFYPVGSNYQFAENTYRLGFHCLTAGPWLAEVLRDRFGAEATPFDLAPDHDVYHRIPSIQRQERTVLFYARWFTERRGFELATAALELLAQREPGLRILLYGSEWLPRKLTFDHRNLGVLPAAQLARLYNEATAGFVVSFTNPSLIPFEMMACGLPVVDVDKESTRSYFGPHTESIITVAEPFPVYIADTLTALLRNPARREEQALRGLEYSVSLSWERSAKQVEQGLLKALDAL